MAVDFRIGIGGPLHRVERAAHLSRLSLTIATAMSTQGLLMPALPAGIVAGVLGATVTFALVIDQAKMLLLRGLGLN